MPRGPAKKKTEDTPSQSLESKLWATADKLRGHLDAADYKHVVLGLIFLKYILDRFAQRHAKILAEGDGADPEDRDEYTAEGVFWVPASARWYVVHAAAKQTDIGKRIDDAMAEIEKENPKLKGIKLGCHDRDLFVSCGMGYRCAWQGASVQCRNFRDDLIGKDHTLAAYRQTGDVQGPRCPGVTGMESIVGSSRSKKPTVCPRSMTQLYETAIRPTTPQITRQISVHVRQTGT